MDYIDNILNSQYDLIDEIDLNKIHLSIRDNISVHIYYVILS